MPFDSQSHVENVWTGEINFKEKVEKFEYIYSVLTKRTSFRKFEQIHTDSKCRVYKYQGMLSWLIQVKVVYQ